MEAVWVYASATPVPTTGCCVRDRATLLFCGSGKATECASVPLIADFFLAYTTPSEIVYNSHLTGTSNSTHDSGYSWIGRVLLVDRAP